MLSEGGFNLTKFILNDKGLLNDIPVSDRATEVTDLTYDLSSKVLGVKWDVTSHQFYFVVSLNDEQKCPPNFTRRSMLSTLSSTFDPLGLVSPVLILGKIIFQDVTRLRIGWYA